MLGRGKRASLVALAVAAVLPAGARGQITIDGTLSAARALTGPNYAITASLGQQRGGNLFHSFAQFNLGTGETATFSGPGSVQNIIARVTGGSASSIDGTILSTIPGANFFLINPSGLIFGAHAQIDVAGSFHAATADHIRFADGAIFSATTPSGSSLTVATPMAFGFLGPSPAALSVTSSILTSSGDLSLVGGPVTIAAAALQAPNARIHIASAASAGDIPIDPTDEPGISATLGPVSIANSFLLTASPPGTGDGVFIHGGQVVVTNSFVNATTILIHADAISLAASRLDASNFGLLDAPGAVDLTATGSIAVTNSTIEAQALASGTASPVSLAGNDITIVGDGVTFSGVSAGVAPGATGNGGTVQITAGDDLELRAAGRIDSSTGGAGNGGAISVTAGRLTISNDGASASAPTEISSGTTAGSTGSGGAITVAVSGAMSILDGGAIMAPTSGAGNGGAIAIRVGNLLMDSQGATAPTAITASVPSAAATGKGGDVTIAVDGSLTMNGAFIQSATAGTNNSGIVTVSAASIAIAGDKTGITASTGGAGDAGLVSVSAGSITVFDGAEIGSNTNGSGKAGAVSVSAQTLDVLSGGSIGTDSLLANSGDAGQVTVAAGNLAIAGNFLGFPSSIRSATAGAGAGGTVQVSANDLTLSGGGLITARSTGTGRAGDVLVQVGDSLTIEGGAAIDTEAASAGGGSIRIAVGSLLFLQNAAITTSVHTGTGNGGNIVIDPPLVVLDQSAIMANAFGGNGGAITIVAGVLIETPDSVIEATSQESISGTITIDAPSTDVTSGLSTLSGKLAAAPRIARAGCEFLTRLRGSSRLVEGGNGGLPSDAVDPLPARFFANAASPPAEGAAGSFAVASAARVRAADPTCR